MKVIKSADARNVVPFPTRKADPIGYELARYIAEKNARQLDEKRLRERKVKELWVAAWIVGAVVAVYVGYWVAR